jgi:AcrR family transcriptional regulator
MRPPSGLSPAERRRQKVRDTILSAAERVFANEGVDGLSIRRLAEDIDYSPAAIYKYFDSKSSLIEELKEAFFERLLERMADANQADVPIRVRARRCCAIYIETALERPHHYAAAFSSVSEFSGQNPMNADVFSKSHKGKAFGNLVALVADGQEAGAFRSDIGAVLAAKSVWAAMHGLAQLMTHMPNFSDMILSEDALEPQSFIHQHVDLVLRGLEIQPTESH